MAIKIVLKLQKKLQHADINLSKKTQKYENISSESYNLAGNI